MRPRRDVCGRWYLVGSRTRQGLAVESVRNAPLVMLCTGEGVSIHRFHDARSSSEGEDGRDSRADSGQVLLIILICCSDAIGAGGAVVAEGPVSAHGPPPLDKRSKRPKSSKYRLFPAKSFKVAETKRIFDFTFRHGQTTRGRLREGARHDKKW